MLCNWLVVKYAYLHRWCQCKQCKWTEIAFYWITSVTKPAMMWPLIERKLAIEIGTHFSVFSKLDLFPIERNRERWDREWERERINVCIRLRVKIVFDIIGDVPAINMYTLPANWDHSSHPFKMQFKYWLKLCVRCHRTKSIVSCQVDNGKFMSFDG